MTVTKDRLLMYHFYPGTMMTVVLCYVLLTTGVYGGNYSEVMDLIHDKLDGARYSTDLRPIINQSKQMDTTVSFSLVGIVEVDDVTQKFTLNGYFTFRWMDELVRWEPSQYGGVSYFHVHPARLWRPRMVLLNSLDEADPFGDDGSSTKVRYDGSVVWSPGGIFLTTCQLNMEKYPFDTQSCHLMMCVMHYHTSDLLLSSPSEPEDVAEDVFRQNKGWTLEDMQLDIVERALVNSSESRSCLFIKVKVKRRPRFSVITILSPLVLLSFLNNIVFLIPIDSQERITYAITVLLAISVMMGTVSTLVPQASDIVPAITIYLFILLIGACLSVMSTIGIEVLLHRHQRDNEDQEDKDPDAVKSVNAVGPSTTNEHGSSGQNRTSDHVHSTILDSKTRTSRVCMRQTFGRCFAATPSNVNRVCFVMTSAFWSVASLWYFSVVME